MALIDPSPLVCAPLGLAALLRSDRENKSLKGNKRVKMSAVAEYHAVVCNVLFHFFIII